MSHRLPVDLDRHASITAHRHGPRCSVVDIRRRREARQHHTGCHTSGAKRSCLPHGHYIDFSVERCRAGVNRPAERDLCHIGEDHAGCRCEFFPVGHEVHGGGWVSNYGCNDAWSLQDETCEAHMTGPGRVQLVDDDRVEASATPLEEGARLASEVRDTDIGQAALQMRQRTGQTAWIWHEPERLRGDVRRAPGQKAQSWARIRRGSNPEYPHQDLVQRAVPSNGNNAIDIGAVLTDESGRVPAACSAHELHSMIWVEPLPKLFRAGRSRALPSDWIHNQEIRGHSAANTLEARLSSARRPHGTADNIKAPSSPDGSVTFVISCGSSVEAGSAAGPHPAAMSARPGEVPVGQPSATTQSVLTVERTELHPRSPGGS